MTTPAHEPEYWLPNYRALTDQECRDLAAGRVPEWLVDACRRMVKWSLETGDVSYAGLSAQHQQRKQDAHHRDSLPVRRRRAR